MALWWSDLISPSSISPPEAKPNTIGPPLNRSGSLPSFGSPWQWRVLSALMPTTEVKR